MTAVNSCAETRTARTAIGTSAERDCRQSHSDRSGRPRRAVSLHLQDGANAYRRFTLGDGSPVTYNHDVLVRRLPDGRPDYADPEYCPVLWRGTDEHS